MAPHPDASVNLFAADPLFRKPIQINFDSRGRLWVASSEVYPQIKPGEVPNDKIVVLEDTDGDGVCDKSTVFAEGLLIPTGVIPDGKGGAFVGASTELLHFEDTDGDGKADRKRVILSGFGTEDTHHLLHTLRWGPDGCLYFNQSIYIHSHIETADGTKHLEGGGIWRYRPETGELSVFCKGFVNPWGHAFDENGESFVTDGAYVEGINYTFPDAVFVSSPGETRFVAGMNPGSPKHCGLDILSGTHIPPSWSGDLVTSDFRGHRVCRFSLNSQHSGYISRQQPEILTTKHVAFRPIDARMGPDGALYIADWYNPIIQHGEVDFRDDRRDREHGRIWRLSFPDRPLDHWPDFETANVEQLLQFLESPSLAVRQFAREHLWPMIRENADAELSVVSRWRDEAKDEKTRASRALEQQWLGEVAGRFEKQAFELIASSAPSDANRASLRSAWRASSRKDSIALNVAKNWVAGEHAASRFESVVVLGQSGDRQAADALVRLAEQLDAPVEFDPILDFALWHALRSTKTQWTTSLREGSLSWKEFGRGVAYAVTASATPEAAGVLLDLVRDQDLEEDQRITFINAIAAAGDSVTLGSLLSIVLEQRGSVAPGEFAAAMTALIDRTKLDRAVPQDADRMLGERFPTVESLPQSTDASSAIIAAAGIWKSQSLVPLLLSRLDSKEQHELHEPILKTLRSFSGPEIENVLAKWAKSESSTAAATAIESISTKQPQRASSMAAEFLSSSSDELVAANLLKALVANKAVAKSLPGFLAKQTLSPDRARALMAAIRRVGGNADIEAALRISGKLEEASWKLSAELSREIVTAAKMGDPVAGESIYRRNELQCIQCHAIGPAGGLVGPNLISLGASSQLDYIVESLLDPNAKLKEGYNTLAVLTDDGRVTSGIPIGRDTTSLRLRLADSKEVVVPLDAIESEQAGKSLMPMGLLDSLTKQELIDLTAFLSSLGRVSQYTVSTKPDVRQYETLVFTTESHSRLNRTSLDTAATDDPALTWRPITARVNATLPIDDLDRFQLLRQAPVASYIRFDVSVGEGESVKVKMPSEGITVWVNGKPMPVDQLIAQPLNAGRHRIVVGIFRDQFKGEWAVRLE